MESGAGSVELEVFIFWGLVCKKKSPTDPAQHEQSGTVGEGAGTSKELGVLQKPSQLPAAHT